MKVYEIRRGQSGNKFLETSIKLAEAIEKSEINVKMKGFGYSTIPKLIYSAAGVKYKKQKSGSFRSTLDFEELKKVIEIESRVIEMLIIDPEIEYDQIKQELLGSL